ncbi:alkylation response protein AidB-like acyl-CoA dehydrogenase [Thermocatellispora tengchongensis]|uniref:Alkylation response protein AidB-like acyl-CoA dehydrogenase n=2 Tax=Thermocatellispora tengchongensis TaxID=1073253 RepID=A0A840PJM5_9ACTN|nr:hypothetical protein [Thermocatellispora tengchongensis]MBB5136265.1 alkylation response protein AidB-like acyl-CoA dehydrogenase [Thermocatellispora tengchongensis]
MARAAIDEVAALSRTKTGPDGVPLAQQRRVQAVLGQAGARVDAAVALLLATLGKLDAAAAEGRPSTEAERGAVRGALPHAAETARAVLISMYELGGSTALYEWSRLGRLFRDGHAAAPPSCRRPTRSWPAAPHRHSRRRPYPLSSLLGPGRVPGR